MPQSRTNYDQMLKEVYGVGLRNALNSSSILLTEITRRADSINFEGRVAKWAVHTGRSGSTASVPELGILPTADRQRFSNVSTGVKTIVHTIKLSKEVIASSKSNVGSFARAMEIETKGAETDIRNNLCRQLVGTGRVQTDTNTTVRTGVIANVNGTPAANVITLDQLEAGSPIALTDGEMRYFFVDMKLDAINPADGSVRQANMTITAIDFAGRTVTVDSSGATADNDFIVANKSYDNEIMGLRVLINDNAGDKWDGTNTATIQGLSSATTPLWASTVFGSRTTAISEPTLEAAANNQWLNGPGTEATLYLTSVAQRSELAGQLQTQKRYDGRMKTLTAGWEGLQVARGTLVVDRYMPDNDFFQLETSELLWFTLLDFQWDDEDGKVLFKTPDQLAYEARYLIMPALGVANRNSHGRTLLAPVP